MAFMFRVPRAPQVDLEQKLQQAREAAAGSKYHLEIQGDTERGKIDGVVQGSYRISDTSIVINIVKKPKMASEARIRDTVTAFFA